MLDKQAKTDIDKKAFSLFVAPDSIDVSPGYRYEVTHKDSE